MRRLTGWTEAGCSGSPTGKPASVPRETSFLNGRNTPETDGRLSSCQNQYRDGHHAILSRPDQRILVLPVSRRSAASGGRAMIELISALLALCSVGVFAAHALDAYRTTHS